MASAGNVISLNHNSIRRDKALPAPPRPPTPPGIASFSSINSPLNGNALGLGIPNVTGGGFVPPPPPPPLPSSKPVSHTRSHSHSVPTLSVPPPPPRLGVGRVNTHGRSQSHTPRFGPIDSTTSYINGNASPNGSNVHPSHHYFRPLSHTATITSPPPPPSIHTPLSPNVNHSYHNYGPSFSTHAHHHRPVSQSPIHGQLNNATTYTDLSAYRPVPPPLHHMSYPQPHSSTPTPPTLSPTSLAPPGAMMLTGYRTPSPFDLGPFPASSIPRNYTPSSTISPPPRPPKPPELQASTDMTASSVPAPPPLPSPISPNGKSTVYNHNHQLYSPETRSGEEAVQSSSSNSSGPVLPTRPNKSPAPHTLSTTTPSMNKGPDANNLLGHASNATPNAHAHLSDEALSPIRSTENDWVLVIGPSRILDGLDHSEMGAPGQDIWREGSLNNLSRTSLSRGMVLENSTAHRDGLVIGGVNGPDDRLEMEDDVRSEGGRTMEAYDPREFDFPRMVNEEMVHVLSPTNETSTQPFLALQGSIQPSIGEGELEDVVTPVPSSQAPREHRSSESFGFGRMGTHTRGASDGDVPPPTYDQVASEISHERQRDVVVVPSTQRSPSPPPAFEPQLPIDAFGTGLPNTAIGTGSGLPVFEEAPPTPTVVRPPHSRTNSGVPTRAIPPIPGHERTASRSTTGYSDHRSATPPSPVTFNHPAIFTSPPTPSPRSSPMQRLQSLRLSLPRRFTVSSTSSRDSASTSDQDLTDPFQDPPSFQVDSSPFALSNVYDSPPRTSNELATPTSPYTEPAPTRASVVEVANRQRSNSGFWSNISSTPPTPRSEHASDEVHRRPEEVVSTRAKRNSTLSTSRMSVFFRGGSSGNNGATAATSGSVRSHRDLAPLTREHDVRPMREGRRSGVDLLGDGGAWRDVSSHGHGNGDTARVHHVMPVTEVAGDPEDSPNGQSIDLWESVEFGFRAPRWTTPPAPGPFSNPVDWPEDITLYPLGSDPFFIRAPTWRSLLRFLASQSMTRIEPSVEALATSRTPTIDLRLVIQFVRNPYTSRGTTRDICLYMILHTEMPSATSKLGRNMTFADRSALESWDTRVLPYGFVCADGGLLSRSNRRGASPVHGPVGTPISEQDPDGDDSMFVTLPPPFIELPVKLSDVAMYLHECLVLSRKNGKGVHENGTNGKGHESTSRIRKPNGSNTHLPRDGASPADQDEPGPSVSHMQATNIKHVPGMKRLAKAVKTYYPDEYAIGSSKANHAAAHAAVDDGTRIKGKMQNVSNTNNHGGSGKSGFLSAFQRVKSKSAVAKQAVGGLSGTSGVGLGGGRDTNAERFELVTPWRQTND